MTPEQIEKYEEAILGVFNEFEEENDDFREERMRDWRKKDNYWHCLQYIFWEDGSYKSIIEDDDADETYVRVLNMYRAHGESIIAAMSTGIPGIRFFPGDSNNTLDIDTAETWSNIWDLIKRRNAMNLLFVKALWTLYQQDFVACHNYNMQSKKYGTPVEEPKYKNVEQTESYYKCPECDFELDGLDTMCPNCHNNIIPIESSRKVMQSVPNGYDLVEHTSEVLEVYGPMNVSVPFHVENPEEITALALYKDKHYSSVRNKYKEFRDKISEDKIDTSLTDLGPHFYVGPTKGLVRLTKFWMTPDRYEQMEEESRKMFERDFPNGLCATIVGEDLVVDIYPENLHTCWTITRSPLSRHIHADSLGNGLMDVQDMENDLTNLIIQTIERGIAETFADPEVIDFEAYEQAPSRPGQLTPAKVPPGMDLSKSFFTTKPATLSREVSSFSQDLINAGQLISGAFPSIYGGSLQGSRTVGEYERSRNSALQRLSIHHKMLKHFIKEISERSVASFIKNLKYDQNDVQFQNGTYQNNWIKREALKGTVGKVEAEDSEGFPISWEQKGEQILTLLKLGNDVVNNALLDPQNTQLLKNLVGIPELYFPGEGSRNKQWFEIQELSQAEPIPMIQPDPTNPQKRERSSIPIMPTDDNKIEYDICVIFLESSKGRRLKQENPVGYKNVLLHAMEHKMAIMPEVPSGERPGNPERREVTREG